MPLKPQGTTTRKLNGYNGNKSTTNSRSLLAKFVQAVLIAANGKRPYTRMDFADDMGVKDRKDAGKYALRDYAAGMVALALEKGYVVRGAMTRQGYTYLPGPNAHEVRTGLDRMRQPAQR